MNIANIIENLPGSFFEVVLKSSISSAQSSRFFGHKSKMGQTFSSAEELTLDGFPLGPTIRRAKNAVISIISVIVFPVLSYIPFVGHLALADQVEQLDEEEKNRIADELAIDKSDLSNLIFDLTTKLDKIIFREKFLEERISEIETIRGICETNLERYESSKVENIETAAEEKAESGQKNPLNDDANEDLQLKKLHEDVDVSIPKLNEEANSHLVLLREERRRCQEKLQELINQRDNLGDNIKVLRASEELASSKNLESIELAGLVQSDDEE